MDSVMDFVNISFIYHAIQNGQLSHYQMINDLKRKNVRDVRDKKRKKLIRAYTERFASVLYQLGPSALILTQKTLKTTRFSGKSIALS